MTAPDVITRSPLINEQGWCAADTFTLRHPKCFDVLSLGDAAGLSTPKADAAIRKQAPLLVHNLLAAMSEKPCDATYDGYTSCARS